MRGGLPVLACLTAPARLTEGAEAVFRRHLQYEGASGVASMQACHKGRGCSAHEPDDVHTWGTGAEEQVYVSGVALADVVVLTTECLHPRTVCELFLR